MTLKTFLWVPGQAGNEEKRKNPYLDVLKPWIPAFAGMTAVGDECDGFQPSQE